LQEYCSAIELSKRGLGSNAEEKTMTTLKIVWRNPNPVCHYSKRRSCKRENERTLYVLQEFMAHGNLGFWMTVCALEMLTGGRAA